MSRKALGWLIGAFVAYSVLCIVVYACKGPGSCLIKDLTAFFWGVPAAIVAYGIQLRFARLRRVDSWMDAFRPAYRHFMTTMEQIENYQQLARSNTEEHRFLVDQLPEWHALLEQINAIVGRKTCPALADFVNRLEAVVDLGSDDEVRTRAAVIMGQTYRNLRGKIHYLYE